MIKKIFVFFFSLLLICLASVPISAAPTPPSLDGVTGAYLYCYESDTVILSKGAHTEIFPAATVKLMTGLLAAELLHTRLDERITVTAKMLESAGGTSMPILAGESYTVRDIYYAAVCGGFNDAVSVLAHVAGGGTENFVSLMNERARELGAYNTHFTNPTGKHDENMVSTLPDVAKIARAAAASSLYITASSASTYTLTGGFTVRNRNGLIGSFYAAGHYNRFARGLVAGDSTENGFSVASVAEYDGLTFLVIVNAPDKDAAYSRANALFDFAFYHYGPLEVIKSGELVMRAPLSLALARDGEDVYMLDLVTPEEVTLYLPYDRNSLSTLDVRPYILDEELKAPVKAGDVVGGADIYIDGVWRGSTDLVAGETVAANPFLLIMSAAKSYFLGRAFIISLILFIILFAVYYYFYEIKRRRTRAKEYKIKNIY